MSGRISRAGSRGVTAVLVLSGAALIGAAALVRWAGVTYTDQLRGSTTVTASGAELAPALIPLALASLAALGALLATRGALRRVVAALLALIGAGVVVIAVRGLVHDPAAELVPTSATAGFAVAVRSPVGPALALTGGVALLVAGIVALVTPGPGGLGGRYERRPTAPPDDELRLWRELDAHRDPTAEPSAEPPAQTPGACDTAPTGEPSDQREDPPR